MFTMLFVNDLAGAPNVPAWLKHFTPPLGNGMTLVDVVFPAFLFVVGMSIPLAFDARRRGGGSTLGTFVHVLLRSGSLLLLGVVMVNFRGWGLWPLLALVASITAFVYIGALPPWAHRLIRLVGLVGLATLILTYHRFHPDRTFQPQWWGILGLIGWAYLVAALIYLAIGPRRTLLITALALLVALYFAAAQTHHANLLSHLTFHGFSLTRWIDVGPYIGSHSAIAVAGVLLGTSLLPDALEQSRAQRCSFALLLVVGLGLGALLTYPSFGVNKTLATPAWSLLSAALTALLFIPVSLLTDPSVSPTCAAASPNTTARLFRPLALLGAAALLVYLLQPLYFRLLSLAGISYNDLAPTPLLAATRAFVASSLLSALAITLHVYRIRLRL